MKKIIIIGASIHQYQLIKKAKEMNLETHVFAWETGAVAKNISDYFYPISITEKEKILEHAYEINPDGIITVGSDLANITVSFIANKLRLTSNSDYTVMLSTNKFEMRKKLSESGLPIPRFKSINNIHEAEEFKYPFMVKSVDRSGSRGICLVKNNEDFEIAFQNALKVSFENYVLIEEYFEGTQYSIETFSQNGEHHFIGLTEEFYTGPPQFVEEKHIMPGRLEQDIFLKVKQTIFSALDVLGIKNGAAHSEIRVNCNYELCIIEIASRMGGDFRYKLVELSNGIDFLRLAILNSLGRIINVPEPENLKAALIKFILNEKEYFAFMQLKNKVDVVQSDILLDNIEADVNDSSQRYGYYIISENTVEDCINILDQFKS